MISWAKSLPLLLVLLVLPIAAQAQSQAAQPQSPVPASAQSDQLLKPEQLDALLAPIALYPDALLAEILMASTYPLEVVEADRWVQANKNLKDDALKTAVDQQSWDDSIKSLVATPSVLDMMSDKLDWTQKLGDAVLAQQADVMDSIQRLRSKAQANDKLNSNQQQTVTTQQQNGKQVIVITPTQPNTVYVPYYNPAVVYGAWPYPAYPPYYWPAPGYIAGGLLATGLAFGAGYALGRWAGGGYWGGGCNWGGNNININRNTTINNINRGGGNNWVHNPTHRQGVRYSNADVASKFGGNRNAGGAQNRLDFRGRGGNQVLNPGAGGGAGLGGGAGNRADIGGGNRPNAGGSGNRPNAGGGNRPDGGAGNRPSAGGGNRPSAGGGNRPSAGGGRGPGNALGNVSSGRVANLDSARGRASLGGGGGGRGGGGGGMRGGGGGGGFARAGGGGGGGRGGGGGGRGGGGGGRRSDIRLKHDIALLGHLDSGIGFYRFAYNGGNTAYVGVIAQEVRTVRPDAVVRGEDGYLRVYYGKLGVKFQTYESWIASGARLPAIPTVAH